MKKIYSLFLICLFAYGSNAQKVITYENVASYTKDEIAAIFSFNFTYGAQVYRVEYESPDVKGNLDTLSGLIAFPDNAELIFPRLSYMHGTVADRFSVPSYQNFESNVAIAMAGLGYASVAPDYPGLGIGRGFHPYVHAKSEARSGVDLMKAMTDIAETESFLLSEQLFITGYSQGGHAAMAMTKMIEEEYANEMTVTASAPMSGPYSISGIMLDFVLDENIYQTPAYLPNVLLSMQTAYGNIFTDLADVIRAPYVDMINSFYQEDIDLLELNEFLIEKLTELEGASIAVKIFKEAYIEDLASNPNHPFLVALQQQDVDNWKANSPIRMFYCTGDDQVSYLNAIEANMKMNDLGSVDTDAEMVGGDNVDHAGCFAPAFLNTAVYFAGFQQIVSPIKEQVLTSFEIFPNPTEGILQFNLPESISLEKVHVINIFGQVESIHTRAANRLDMTSASKGMKVLEFYNSVGELVGIEKVMVH